jgi:hypothetical protein
MLLIRMALPIPFADHVKKCKCGIEPSVDEHTATALLTGRHYMTTCPKSWRIHIHNCIRDKVAAMYKAVQANFGVEVRGLYSQLTSYGEHKPADVLVYSGSVHQDQYPGKAVALDVAITDPCTKTALNLHSDQRPLVAASDRHGQKLSNHNRAVRQAARDGTGPLPFEKAPFVLDLWCVQQFHTELVQEDGKD